MEYITHLSADKRLKKIIESHEPIRLRRKKDIFLHLVASIMSQQLSTKVAQVIYSRFLNLFDSASPQPEDILRLKPETLRNIGLSNAKVTYVRNVAQFAIEHGLDHRKLNKMNNEDVIEYLTRIKGVGRWTVEMQLMFTMGREDIFPVNDLGIQTAMIRLYKLEHLEKKLLTGKMLQISEKWSPFRTYACLHLWKWKDANR